MKFTRLLNPDKNIGKIMIMIPVKLNHGLRRKSLFPASSIVSEIFKSTWPDVEQFPAANVQEKEKEYLIELSIPGFTKKDIRIQLDDNNILQISGKKEEKTEDETENYTSKEFGYSSFSRSFELPDIIDENEVNAQIDNGILKIKIPKKETAVLRKSRKEIPVI